MVSVSSADGLPKPAVSSVTVTVNSPQHPPTFVSRVTSIPVVAEAYSAVNNAVNSLAEKNKYAKYAVDTTNNAVHSVVNTASKYAEPYQQRFGPQISKVDEMGTRMLDMVESKFPIITKPSAQVIDDARGAVSQVKDSVALSKPVTSASHVIKNLEVALTSVMDNLENMVDRYLPEEQRVDTNGRANASTDANGDVNGNHHIATEQMKRAVLLSLDVQRRLARKVVTQIKHLQASIPDATQEIMKLKESSHLIQAATESMRSLNDKLTPIIAHLHENAAMLKETGVERAKALDAQFEISERIEPVIKSYLAEISALTEYIQAHIPSISMKKTSAHGASENERVRVIRIVDSDQKSVDDAQK